MIVLVVDDEQPARKKVITFLKSYPKEMDILEAANGREALKIIQMNKPDLIFLDIQMPGLNGFEVISHLPAHYAPVIIFVTAFDQHALNAFEVNAVDYLLKPFDKNRFIKALERGLQQLDVKNRNASDLQLLLSTLQKKQSFVERIMVNAGPRLFFINTKDIVFISAEEKYINLHLEKASYLLRDTLTNIETTLNPELFVRVHRSYIVNMEFIKEMQPWAHGDFVIILKTGEELPVSRRYKTNLFKK